MALDLKDDSCVDGGNAARRRSPSTGTRKPSRPPSQQINRPPYREAGSIVPTPHPPKPLSPGRRFRLGRDTRPNRDRGPPKHPSGPRCHAPENHEDGGGTTSQAWGAATAVPWAAWAFVARGGPSPCALCSATGGPAHLLRGTRSGCPTGQPPSPCFALVRSDRTSVLHRFDLPVCGCNMMCCRGPRER